MNLWAERVLGALAWAVVVGVGSVLVWLVISRVGAGLVADTGPVLTPSATPPTTTGSPTTGPAGLARRATWDGEAGAVTAACLQARVSLVGAQPADGTSVRVLERGPERLVVAFAGANVPTTVVARCQDGAPAFAVSHQPGAPSEPPDTSPDRARESD